LVILDCTYLQTAELETITKYFTISDAIFAVIFPICLLTNLFFGILVFSNAPETCNESKPINCTQSLVMTKFFYAIIVTVIQIEIVSADYTINKKAHMDNADT
jgi:hypothetical protein